MVVSNAVALSATTSVFFVRVLCQVAEHANHCFGTEVMTDHLHVAMAFSNQRSRSVCVMVTLCSFLLGLQALDVTFRTSSDYNDYLST